MADPLEKEKEGESSPIGYRTYDKDFKPEGIFTIHTNVPSASEGPRIIDGKPKQKDTILQQWARNELDFKEEAEIDYAASPTPNQTEIFNGKHLDYSLNSSDK
jgi:hypothetical protein